MNFLTDAQLPPALCRWLEARGHARPQSAALW
jgi:predicted nuclease of predicted toxin-antitoxin system